MSKNTLTTGRKRLYGIFIPDHHAALGDGAGTLV
jgi:hypothetical protein